MEKDEVRKRKSYDRWELYQLMLSKCNTVGDIMRMTHEMINVMEGYGSKRSAEMGEESLTLLIEDRNLDKYNVKYADMTAGLKGGV